MKTDPEWNRIPWWGKALTMLASLLVGGLILWSIWWRITTPPSVVNLAGEDRATRQAECTHAWVVGNERAKRHYCPEFDREREKLENHDRLPMSPTTMRVV
jgi:hypothetical protein